MDLEFEEVGALDHRLRFKLKPLVPGENIEGEVVKVEALSFYGEVDPKEGTLYDGRKLKDRILVIGRSRGSTVGSYIVYGLKYYGNEPRAIVMKKSEPIVIVGAILAGIPLYEGLSEDVFNLLVDGCFMRISPEGDAEVFNCS